MLHRRHQEDQHQDVYATTGRGSRGMPSYVGCTTKFRFRDFVHCHTLSFRSLTQMMLFATRPILEDLKLFLPLSGSPSLYPSPSPLLFRSLLSYPLPPPFSPPDYCPTSPPPPPPVVGESSSRYDCGCSSDATREVRLLLGVSVCAPRNRDARLFQRHLGQQRSQTRPHSASLLQGEIH